jgi:imidazoleglycerol-phosphate dehydratase/histidinol-phosphatase
MKKVLFIDRDGTLIKEPEDEQIDSFEKLDFYPEVFTYMSKIASELDYELVMITNQDGLGTSTYPENTFWPVQNFIIHTFKNEGVHFEDVYIDKTFPEENSPTRKPKTGLLTKYFESGYDLENSFVIGDRMTDVELAKNLGAKGIFIDNQTNLGEGETVNSDSELESSVALSTNNWKEIYSFLKLETRTASLKRTTKRLILRSLLT